MLKTAVALIATLLVLTMVVALFGGCVRCPNKMPQRDGLASPTPSDRIDTDGNLHAMSPAPVKQVSFETEQPFRVGAHPTTAGISAAATGPTAVPTGIDGYDDGFATIS